MRVNKVENNIHYKHFYKSYYEPNEVVVDRRFLDSLSEIDIRNGIAEVVKHAIYQSKELLSYLNSMEFNPVTDRNSLWKAIAWTASLKKVCLDVDPEESNDGARFILRAAHDTSDKLEEASKFTLSHGEAVLMAIWKELSESGQMTEDVKKLYDKFQFPKV